MLEDRVLDELVLPFRPLADWWANKIQWCEEDHEDLVQEGMFELIKTVRGYQKSGKEIRDLKSLASCCFSAAMKWYYKKSDRVMNFIDYDSLKIPVDNIEVHFSVVWMEEYLRELEAVHGRVAREIVQLLVNPDERVGEIAKEIMATKKAAKDAGANVIGYASAGGGKWVQKQFIRLALGIDPKDWDRELANIKVFTKDYICRRHGSRTGSSQSLSPS